MNPGLSQAHEPRGVTDHRARAPLADAFPAELIHVAERSSFVALIRGAKRGEEGACQRRD